MYYKEQSIFVCKFYLPTNTTIIENVSFNRIVLNQYNFVKKFCDKFSSISKHFYYLEIVQYTNFFQVR